MASDKHIWLKDLPLHIAFVLGYELLPGLLALKKEGAHWVEEDYPAIEHDCLVLVDRFEEVRRAIKKDISIEYRHMVDGSSLLEPLIDDAISLVQKALAVGDASPGRWGLSSWPDTEQEVLCVNQSLHLN
ncbi:MAG: hypothetical protein ACKOWD_09950 [Rhodoferax sp.]